MGMKKVEEKGVVGRNGNTKEAKVAKGSIKRT
jgi:hypothetical protein